ncbi:macrolide family glycosyltransferase [Streptacidiphilus sp. EB129]|uniref:macrolide family glycosyltransferase n=1 Tax=Streptacidiphilus sp. EB129 TaxID=3156262 RepID=UPI0035110649
MAHVAILTPPSSGHVNPTLGVAAELLRRGHRVSYATTDDYAERVGEVSTAVVRYREQHAGDFRSFRFTGRSLVDAMSASLAETAALYPELLRAFADDRPDLVVYDNGAWWGRLLAEHWQVPAVQVCPMLVSNEHWSMADRYTRLSPFSPRLWVFFARMSRLLRELGSTVSPKDLLTGNGAERRLVFIPRAFQYRGETFDDSFRFVGPCLHPRRFLGSWQLPADHRGPLVLVTLGTIYNQHPDFFRTCIAACTGLGGRVVVAVGDGVDPDDLGPPPADVEVHRFVPQLQVLPHADLFITHAGMGSTMEALYHGVPMLAVPQMAEEQANADRIAELGIGRTLAPEGLTAAVLRSAVQQLLADEAVRRRAAALRDETRSAGGAAAAADAIEARLRDHVAV